MSARKAARMKFVKRVGLLSIVAPVTLKCVVNGSPALDVLAAVGVGAASLESGALLEYSGVPVSNIATVTVSLAVLRAGVIGYVIAIPVLAVQRNEVMGFSSLWPRLPSVLAVSSYVALPIRAGIKVRQADDGLNWLVYGIVSTWINDAANYVIGPFVPGRSLPAWLNDKKSWAGYLPGIGVSVLAARFAASKLGISKREAVCLGLFMGLASAAGDMFESGLKRRAKRVDSGNFLPGYGGVLDRLDSLLTATSVLYWAHRRWSTNTTNLSVYG
jgi:CDP-diglyceride synthetase